MLADHNFWARWSLLQRQFERANDRSESVEALKTEGNTTSWHQQVGGIACAGFLKMFRFFYWGNNIRTV